VHLGIKKEIYIRKNTGGFKLHIKIKNMDQTELETFLQASILPVLEKGRKNWDKEHTLAVVHYLKEILKHIDYNLDETVLLIAAYAHDWGYSGLFLHPNVQLDEVAKQKKLHAIRGAEMLAKLLQSPFFNVLSPAQKERAVHLVKVHDELESLVSKDEIILMEADTLGGLDIKRVKPTFNKQSNVKYIAGVKKKRLPLFAHKFSIQKAHMLLAERENYYKNYKLTDG